MRRHCLDRTIPKKSSARGQGLIETAILLPVLLVILSGLLEFGFLLNQYMALQDTARNSSRYGSDLLYTSRDNVTNCVPTTPGGADSTKDFYRQIACVVDREIKQERPDLAFDYTNGHDDIIISVFSVISGTVANPVAPQVTARFPAEYGEQGWSGGLDFDAYGVRNQVSKFSTAEVNSRLHGGAPNTGFLLVEVFYDYHQVLKLPWITAFLSDPVTLHAYAFMPLVSAEPTTTPLP